MAAMPSNRVSTSNNQGAGTADGGVRYLALMAGVHARRGGRSWVGACRRSAKLTPSYRGVRRAAGASTPTPTIHAEGGAPRAPSSEQRAIRTGGGS